MREDREVQLKNPIIEKNEENIVMMTWISLVA